jgi:CBS-domain-containing membrane protein
MSKSAFSPLPFLSLEEPISYFRPRQELPVRVNFASPAVDCMTDLRQVAAVAVGMERTVDEALNRMRKRGVRLLLVTDDDATVYGLITARDIQGEKPIKLAQKLGDKPGQLLVRDLMTLQGRLEVLDYQSVLKARVGDIIATLKDAGRQHALVVDRDPQADDHLALRGIFSMSQIGRQLGLPLDTAERATTFAELEAALKA